MSHFTDDCITTVEGTYCQLYAPHGPTDENLKEYSTSIAAWYDECQLMATEGRTLEECRAACIDYFGDSYEEMIAEKQKNKENSPLMKMLIESLKEEMPKIRTLLEDSF